MMKTYLSLTKPRIIFGNVVTLAAGFALASKVHINYWLLLATLVGLSFVIASGCVFNNILDRDIDAKMERTKNRALVTGLVSARRATIYGTCLGLFGFLVLARYTNLLATGIALVGFLVYVGLYSPLKRRSTFAVLVGSIAGAVPPLVGYATASGRVNAAAFILFLILSLWQMPHFFAISLYRADEYAAASIPVLPIKKGIRGTKIAMLCYIALFTVAALSLTAFGFTGYAYLGVVSLLCLGWIWFAIKGFYTKDTRRWARGMFIFSLVVLTLVCIMIWVDVVSAAP